jgi:hypothetical protein
MKFSNLSLQAECHGTPLQLIVRFDSEIIFDQLLTESAVITHEFPDESCVHTIELEMVGKLPSHTTLDSAGNIVNDCLIEITQIQLAGIDITPVFLPASEYTHNFNGTKETDTYDFYGSMGCNGVVEFAFDGPVYRWLLESL